MDSKSVACGVLIGGTAALLWSRYSERSRNKVIESFLASKLSASAPSADSAINSSTEDISKEQFVRNEQFFGESGQALVQAGRVIVVGAGGVGSHCAVTLARSGVGHIRIIDFDRVTVSSLNRHASAIRSKVGISKVDSLKRYIKSFAPDCVVDALEGLFEYKSAQELIAAFNPDWVVDAIDNINTKVDLLAFCHENKIKVICACGSAAKCDPTRIRISTIDNSSEDALARAVRQKLRLQRGLTNTQIPVVYSTERTERGLLPLKDFQEDNPKEFQTLEKFRVRILPVIAPLSSIMGNAVASHILCHLARQPFSPLTTAPVSSASHRKKLWNFVRRAFPLCGPQTADSPTADLLLDIVFDACSGRSVVSGDGANLCMVPYTWSEQMTFDPSDLILMTSTEAKEYVINKKSVVVPEEKVGMIREKIRSEMKHI